jgi:DNA replication licensing factor MCM4
LLKLLEPEASEAAQTVFHQVLTKDALRFQTFRSYHSRKNIFAINFIFRVLLTPGMQSSFRRQRGFLDVNRLLNAPTFNRERAPLDGRA